MSDEAKFIIGLLVFMNAALIIGLLLGVAIALENSRKDKDDG